MRFLPNKQWLRSIYTKKKNAHQMPEQINQLINNLDWEKIEKSLSLRQQNNSTGHLRELVKNLESANDNEILKLRDELFKLPNYVHPRVWNYGNDIKELYRFDPDKTSRATPVEFSELCKQMNIFRMDHLGNYTGHKSYYLFGKLAELEQALSQYTQDVLKRNSFQLMSVPDILPKEVIEGCGMQTDGERAQVYKLESGTCLSGTSEMALAGFFANTTLRESDLPKKVAAVSRCYRAETSGLNEEKGIYRVHQFTKVEMFSVCTENQSEDILETFKELEMGLFKNLNINFRLLDMPPTELGAPAYQKYDIETWMPGRKIWGELSSCSNCTDYQAQRLNINYITNNGKVRYAHTVNGTAAAIPRLLISLIESNQIDKNTVKIPNVLLKYMSSGDVTKEKAMPEMKFVKHLKSNV